MRVDNRLPASYYEASAQRRAFGPPLAESAEADVCVVGGGFTGVSAALNLAERGRKVVLLEARKVGWGASGRNGGQFIFGFAARDLDGIARSAGLDSAKPLWELAVEAVQTLRDRVSRHSIDCDFQEGFMEVAVKPRQLRELEETRRHLSEAHGREVEFLDRARLREVLASDLYLGGIYDRFSGHIHPLKYLLGLAQAAEDAGADIREDTPAVRIEAGDTPRVVTATGEVRCGKVVLACNAYVGDLQPGMASRVMPVGTYMCATRPLGKERADALIGNRACVCDANFVLDYFRLSADHRMLFGGRVSYSAREPRNMVGVMRARMVRAFPQLRSEDVDFCWGGNVAITIRRFPDFGRAGDNVLYAQGFSGHGIALTGLAGKLLAEAAEGDPSRFDRIARYEHRPFPGGKGLRTPLLVLGMLWHRMRDRL